ncbi:DUF6325 family protein [Gordonia sp. DT30]|uniref:DUF6325 family protein n=1 Tax=unclassified Gordonia (in: high G+C Gram-positive bacteria) TaxID=2657482 RepID=UPI003CFA8CD0
MSAQRPRTSVDDEEAGMHATATDAERDDLGPIDYLVIELAPGTGDVPDSIRAALAQMVSAGMVRVLDLVVVGRNSDGMTVSEAEDLEPGMPTEVSATLAEVLALEDLDNLAPAITGGRSAVIIVWEYTCTRNLGRVAAHSGAEIVAQGRIPVRDLMFALGDGT